MKTDIHLYGENRKINIDTKYYVNALQEYHGKFSFPSGNLYQMFSYLKNVEAIGPDYWDVEEILLYPVVGESVDANYEIQGHKLKVASIKLDQPWPQISKDLLELIALEPAVSIV